jgi:general secretion pathway protein D
VSAQVENAQNLFAASCSIQYDSKLLRLVEVQNGGFLSSDGKLIALAPRTDNDTGQAVISISRPPESTGLSGNGSLLTLVFEAVAPGNAQINFTQGTVRDSTQTTLPASFSSAYVTIK